MTADICYACRKNPSAFHLVVNGKPRHLCPSCHSKVEGAAVARRDSIQVRKEGGRWCVSGSSISSGGCVGN